VDGSPNALCGGFRSSYNVTLVMLSDLWNRRTCELCEYNNELYMFVSVNWTCNLIGYNVFVYISYELAVDIMCL